MGDGVFDELDLPSVPDESDSRFRLISELGRIHRLGWIDSKQLDSHGRLKPCNAPQCGGFTLEAEFGIPKNSTSEPDFLGWEIKQHKVSSFSHPVSNASITLMTPEPTGGFYKEHGVEAFVRTFGYLDKNDIPDRMNFGGNYRVGIRHPGTRLTLMLEGYDFDKGIIRDAKGAVNLVSDSGVVAASWAFGGLVEHWSRKHMKAVYVPSQCRDEPHRQYCYGNKVRLAQRTNPMKLIKAMVAGAVFYDPGIKLENISTKPVSKRRSQFRIASKNIAALYETVEEVAV